MTIPSDTAVNKSNGRGLETDRTDRFKGARVAVTGGTSGLGLALVRELLARGAQVAFVARTRERVEQVAREQLGAHGIVGDISSKDDIYPIAVQVVGELGGCARRRPFDAEATRNIGARTGRRHRRCAATEGDCECEACVCF